MSAFCSVNPHMGVVEWMIWMYVKSHGKEDQKGEVKSKTIVTIHVPQAFILPGVSSYGAVYRGMLPGTGDDHRV